MSSQLSFGGNSTLKENQYYTSCPVPGLTQSIGYSSMQASHKHDSSSSSSGLASTTTLSYQPIQESDFFYLPNRHHHNKYQSLNQHLSSQDDSSSLMEVSTCPHSYNSPSTLTYSPNGSSNVQEFDTNIMMMITDPETEIDDQAHWSTNCKRMMEVISRKDLKEMMIVCAEAVSDNELLMADLLIDELKKLVSVSGDPVQRLGAYILEGLVARLDSSGNCIYKSLKCNIPAGSKLLSYMQVLYQICPYYKFGYASANGAILKAVEQENKIHIIDFQIAQGSQWIPLIQNLATRPGGPPHIRITGVDDDQSAYARGGGLHLVGQRLMKLAESCKIPFKFHAAAICGSDVVLGNLGIRPREAIAVNFPFVLHHMPDESVGLENHRDRLLRLVKSLSPKVVTLVEQESNTNTAAFLPRFIETLSFYTAMFESVDVASLPRDSKERINVEQNCLARDVVSIIACEGAERVERHELLGKWKSRFLMAGFTPWPLSSKIKGSVKKVLEDYSKNYTLEERDGALYLGWRNRRLFTSSAWR